METWEGDSLLAQWEEFHDRPLGHIVQYDNVSLHSSFHYKVHCCQANGFGWVGELVSLLQCNAENCLPPCFTLYLLCLFPGVSLLPPSWVFLLEYLYLPFRFGSVRCLSICYKYFVYALTTIVHCISYLPTYRGPVIYISLWN